MTQEEIAQLHETVSIGDQTTPMGLSGLLGNIFSGPGISQLISGAANAALTEADIERLRNIGPQTTQLASGLAGEAAERAQFQPFTITSTPGLGQANVTQQGIGLTAGPQQEALTQQAFQGAQTALQGLLAPRADREAQILAQLEAATLPAQQRAALELENRLFGQGRGGVTTSAYGGTPEQFALAQAQEEQRARNALSAMTQAGTEQTQQSQLLSSLLGTAYTPQTQALNLLQGAAPSMQISQAGRLSGSEAFQSAIPTIIQATAEGEASAANLRNEQLKTLVGLLAPTTSAAIGAAGQQSIGDVIGGTISGGLEDLYNQIFG